MQGGDSLPLCAPAPPLQPNRKDNPIPSPNAIPETSGKDLKDGQFQIRFIAGKTYYVSLRHRPVSETANPTASRWLVGVHERDTNARVDSYAFDYLTDARRSFRALVQYLAAGKSPHAAYPMGINSDPPEWASFKTLHKMMGLTD